MANENNNINELVDADDDPTVELELPGFRLASVEADAKTYDRNDDEVSNGVENASVSELESDLKSRNKTISQLQYDIQQLHARWVGLEAEIGARESQTEQLNEELSALRESVTRKDKLITKRDRKIRSLKSEIRQRDTDYRALSAQFDEVNRSLTELAHESERLEAALTVSESQFDAKQLQQQLDRSEEYADTIRRQLQDLIASKAAADREFDTVSASVTQITDENQRLKEELAQMSATADEMRSKLDSAGKRHEEEIRTLRFELGEAQDTAVESEDLKTQLAADLVDARGVKESLEQTLADVENSSAERIEKMQKKIDKLSGSNAEYERKLNAKSEAINALLGELAKKTEQLESISEIENVIQDIDERMSEQSFRSGEPDRSANGERVSRVLMGTVDDQILRFPLFKDRLTIGRTNDNDIQLKAAYVSRRHAVIETEGDTTRIIDWGSKNGVIVNSEKIDEHALVHGDIVMIGNARFRYEQRKKRES